MPETPKMKTKKKSYGWTRTGCRTCKRRRKKCDELKPECRNCLRLGLQCLASDNFQQMPMEVFSPRRPVTNDATDSHDYSLLSSPSNTSSSSLSPPDVTSVETADILAPLRSPTVHNADTVLFGHHETDLLGSFMADAESPFNAASILTLGIFDTGKNSESGLSPLPSPLGDNGDNGSCQISEKCDVKSSGIFPLLRDEYLSTTSNISSMELFLLQYHINRLCSILVNVDGPNNPMRSVLIPRAIVSPMLLDAICAVSACHLSNDQPHLQSIALAYHTRALNALNSTLSRFYDSTSRDDAIDREATSLTATFLCKYEIMNGSVTKWRQHLIGLENIVEMEGFRIPMSKETSEYVRSFITYHGHYAEISNNIVQMMVRKPTHPVEALPKSWQGPSRSIDPYMGISETLIELLSRVSQLLVLNSFDNLLTEVDTINKILSSTSWTSSFFQIPTGFSPTTIQRLESVASAYIKGIYVYLHSIVNFLAGPEKCCLTIYQRRILRQRISCTMEEAIGQCLEHISAVPRKDPCEAALVFLLFLVGCETDSADEFDVAFSRLECMEKTLHIGSIRRARMVLELVWDANNKPGPRRSWQGILRDTSWDLILS